MSLLKVNELQPQTGSDIAVTANVAIGTTGAPTTLDVSGNATIKGNLILDDTSTGAVIITEQTVNPSDPTSGTQCKLYMKGDKLILQYNDAGTVRYKYLDLTGTGVTWTHTTVAP